jgi:hypothetical protein
MHDTAGKTAWVTIKNGSVLEQFKFEPMTTPAQRAKAEAIALIPDTGQM